MLNPSACDMPSDLCGPFDGDDDKNPDPPRERFTGLDLCLAATQGQFAGQEFAAAEALYDRSPCGIHLYPVRTIRCDRCARLAASLPAFLDAQDHPVWFTQQIQD